MFLLLFFFLSSLPCSTADNHFYLECSPRPFTCGGISINISYPFRIDGRPVECGHPGYSIRCANDSTFVTTISNREYHINAIDYNSSHIAVADASFFGVSCPYPTGNTTVNLTLYEYTDLNTAVIFFMNCTFPRELPSGVLNLSCAAGNIYMVGANSNGVGKSCGSAVQVVLHQTVVDLLVRNEVDIGAALQQGFTLKWTAGVGWCDDCVASGGVCGYDMNSPNQAACFCASGACSSAAGKSRLIKKLVTGLATGVMFLLLMCIALYYYNHHPKSLDSILRKKSKIVKTIESFLDTCETLGPKRYRYSDLKKITKSFSEKLGQGGFGSVYKGELPDGRLVAVKVLTDAKGNGDEFMNEVASIGKTSHVNVVSLLGFSSEGTKRALLYEFMLNGSLEKYIYSENLKSMLGWEKLYQIAIGIARGLEYLHRGCSTHIVHFDIKPHNILLDQDFCPKISDFGLAKLCLKKDSIFSAIDMRGTIGYIAPEVFSRNFGVVSSKSDVYSYGMMVLEMVGGRNNLVLDTQSSSGSFFPNWIHEHFHQIGHVEGVNIAGEMEEIAKKLALVGLWCIQTKPGSRPSMNKVLDMLESSLDELEMPPKPSFLSP
ncbi:hypothetical protein HPP92_000461 [Vanilla planifolia]|uniref:Protein kinase domain-containing protein n=1 Tax=Vanilla planifolia TaxID=51239 RepID=A0A835S287_VANPL|nr:hypothetical protein HPP92_000488 [Vanilla planifolia]KAG0500389.1 hypothetical protein HPP92_000461 [Vanilla planifolia]